MSKVLGIAFGLYLLSQYLPAAIFWSLTIGAFGVLWWFTSTGMSLRRKVSIATWSPPDCPQIYAKISMDVTKAQGYLQQLREKNPNSKVTITHLIGKAAGLALSKSGGLNGRLVWGRHLSNTTVDISFLVSVDGGKNLAPTVIRDIPSKSTVELCDELSNYATRVRKNSDPEFQKNMDVARTFPTFALNFLFKTVGFLAGNVGLSFPALGIKPKPFGCCMITNVGVFGVDEAYAPLTPFAATPVLLLIGTIADKAVVRDGQVVVKPMIKIMATIDHRFIDGAEAAQIGKKLQEYIENPETIDQ